MKKARTTSGTGLARHASTVALTAARSVTSHARKRYHSHYRGRYRSAWLVFLFDITLLGVALALLVVNLVIFGNPFAKPIGLSLSLQHGDVIAGTLTPVEVTVRSTDGIAHEETQLNWRFPSWVEVMRADPPIARGIMQLGRVAPGEPITARLYLRVRATPGTHVPINVEIRQGGIFGSPSSLRQDEMTVTASALTVEPVIPIEGVVPGGSIPLEVKNTGTLAAPAVIVRLTSKDGAPASRLDQGDQAILGNVAPGERRILLLDVDPMAHGRLDFAWEVQDASHAVSAYAFNAVSAEPIGVNIAEPLTSTPMQPSTDVQYDASSTASLFVLHPLHATTTDAVLPSFTLTPGTGVVRVPLQANRAVTESHWWVLPYVMRGDKGVFGKRVDGTLQTAFPVSLTARYYSESGDQIGVGPLPPTVGIPTTYWLVWSVGPTDSDVRDLVLRATLGDNVRATGKSASIIPGEFSFQGKEIEWTIPSLPETGALPVTFAFEVSLTPTADQRGAVPLLTKGFTATATEIRSGTLLRMSGGTEDANLSRDEKAHGYGIVE